MMQATKKLNSVLGNSLSLKDLSQTFSTLDELNTILHKALPEHLIDHCHVGAIDIQKNLVIVYLANSSLRHVIENMANPILESFNNYHFSFAGLVTRIRPQAVNNPPRFKKLKPEVKNKLGQLAQSINRPDLIEDEVVVDKVKEIDF
ncbi:MAG TPA: hypothetical protein VKR58_09225 [Aquella sp.]|nr:hypothetical protein [Aquella sp.]